MSQTKCLPWLPLLIYSVGRYTCYDLSVEVSQHQCPVSDMDIFRRRWTNGLAQMECCHEWVALFWGACQKHNTSPLELILPSSPSTRELHVSVMVFFNGRLANSSFVYDMSITVSKLGWDWTDTGLFLLLLNNSKSESWSGFRQCDQMARLYLCSISGHFCQWLCLIAKKFAKEG